MATALGAGWSGFSERFPTSEADGAIAHRFIGNEDHPTEPRRSLTDHELVTYPSEGRRERPARRSNRTSCECAGEGAEALGFTVLIRPIRSKFQCLRNSLRRALPVVSAVRGTHRHGWMSSGTTPRVRRAIPHEWATQRSLRSAATDRTRLAANDAVASATKRRRLRLEPRSSGLLSILGELNDQVNRLVRRLSYRAERLREALNPLSQECSTKGARSVQPTQRKERRKQLTEVNVY